MRRAGDLSPAIPRPYTEQRMEQGAEREAWRRGERKRLIAERLALAPEERARREAAIDARLSALLARLAGDIIGAYWPIKGEFDPRPMAARLAASGRVVALPAAVEASAPLEYRRWQAGDPLAPGRHGIPEPRQGPVVLPAILLVPLVGFDAGLYRLGYGGGYFDRTLATLAPRPLGIGIGFEAALLPNIDPAAHDVALDFIVTETQLRERGL